MPGNKFSTFYYLLAVFFVVLSYFLFLQFKSYTLRQAGLITQLRALRDESETRIKDRELYGDGRFLREISKMTSQQKKEMIPQIGEKDCDSFIGFVLGGEDLSDMRDWGKGLDYGLKDAVQSDLQKIPGVSGEAVWEGLKEINRLLNRVHELKEDFSSQEDDATRISSIGEQEERASQDKTEEDRKLDDEGVEDAMKDMSAAETRDFSEDSLLREKMKEISALVLSRVQVQDRRKVLGVLKARFSKN